MNIEKIKAAAKFSSGVSMEDLLRLEAVLGKPIPAGYKTFLKLTNGAIFDGGLVIYSTEELYERNETIGIFEYLPNYLSIGDDSGGQSVIMPYDGVGIYSVGHGFLNEANFETLGATLEEWVGNGCSMP